jgi:hypothetical protein
VRAVQRRKRIVALEQLAGADAYSVQHTHPRIVYPNAHECKAR